MHLKVIQHIEDQMLHQRRKVWDEFKAELELQNFHSTELESVEE
jgi:hypothetical protein